MQRNLPPPLHYRVDSGKQSDPGHGVIRASQVSEITCALDANVCLYFAIRLVSDGHGLSVVAVSNDYAFKLAHRPVQLVKPAKVWMLFEQTKAVLQCVLTVGTDSDFDGTAAATVAGTAGPSSAAAPRHDQSRRLPPSPRRTRSGSSPPRSKRRRMSKYGSDGSVGEDEEHELYCTAHSGSATSGDPAADRDDDYNTSKRPGFAPSLLPLPLVPTPAVAVTACIKTTRWSLPRHGVFADCLGPCRSNCAHLSAAIVKSQQR